MTTQAAEKEYRVYRTEGQNYNTYLQMHTNQTVEFVQGKHKQWESFSHGSYTIFEALQLLDQVIDESDPDLIGLPNIVHAIQTAEMIRADHPEKRWFQVTGLIHDLGKVLAAWGEPQWCVVGDTYPVGCMPGDCVVYGSKSFMNNADMENPKYNTKYGMYEKNCGLDNLLMSWGHDEYLYQVLRNHDACTLPEPAYEIIRFHSFYPWHEGGDYKHFLCPKDEETFRWVKEFNKYDLYSKCDVVPDMESLLPYYQKIIDEFIPGKVRF